MIKISLKNLAYIKDSAQELTDTLTKVQARTRTRNISYSDAYNKALDMTAKLKQLLPGTEGIGAKITYVKAPAKFVNSYGGTPKGTRLTVTKHAQYATVEVDRYYAKIAYAHEYSLDLSHVKNSEKVTQSLTRRVLRQYQKSISTKIDFN